MHSYSAKIWQMILENSPAKMSQGWTNLNEKGTLITVSLAQHITEAFSLQTPFTDVRKHHRNFSTVSLVSRTWIWLCLEPTVNAFSA